MSGVDYELQPISRRRLGFFGVLAGAAGLWFSGATLAHAQETGLPDPETMGEVIEAEEPETQEKQPENAEEQAILTLEQRVDAQVFKSALSFYERVASEKKDVLKGLDFFVFKSEFITTKKDENLEKEFSEYCKSLEDIWNIENEKLRDYLTSHQEVPRAYFKEGTSEDIFKYLKGLKEVGDARLFKLNDGYVLVGFEEGSEDFLKRVEKTFSKYLLSHPTSDFEKKIWRGYAALRERAASEPLAVMSKNVSKNRSYASVLGKNHAAVNSNFDVSGGGRGSTKMSSVFSRFQFSESPGHLWSREVMAVLLNSEFRLPDTARVKEQTIAGNARLRLGNLFFEGAFESLRSTTNNPVTTSTTEDASTRVDSTTSSKSQKDSTFEGARMSFKSLDVILFRNESVEQVSSTTVINVTNKINPAGSFTDTINSVSPKVKVESAGALLGWRTSLTPEMSYSLIGKIEQFDASKDYDVYSIFLRTEGDFNNTVWSSVLGRNFVSDSGFSETPLTFNVITKLRSNLALFGGVASPDDRSFYGRGGLVIGSDIGRPELRVVNKRFSRIDDLALGLLPHLGESLERNELLNLDQDIELRFTGSNAVMLYASGGDLDDSKFFQLGVEGFINLKQMGGRTLNPGFRFFIDDYSQAYNFNLGLGSERKNVSLFWQHQEDDSIQDGKFEVIGLSYRGTLR